MDRRVRVAALGYLTLVGSLAAAIVWVAVAPEPTLSELRESLETEIALESGQFLPEEPPADVFELLRYPAPLGENWAYVSPIASERRPGVVYVAGGFDFGIGSFAWTHAPWEDDQSARAFRVAGLALMLPSLRGAHDNPGSRECLFGEVEDILAAADYLASRPDVDPERIYLVGHSTGATLALLVAETSERFRGVIAIGPVASVVEYEDSCLSPWADVDEIRARTPFFFVDEIQTPTLIIEGVEQPSNIDSLESYRGVVSDPPITTLAVAALDHFSVLAPASEVVARAILDDVGPIPALRVRAEEITARAGEGRSRECGTSLFEASEESDGARRAFDPEAVQPPQVLLTHDARLRYENPLQGGGAFILRAPGGRLVLATVSHRGRPLPYDEGLLGDGVLLDREEFLDAVESWSAHPPARPTDRIVVTGLAEPALFGDWLLLDIGGELPPGVEALSLARAPIEPGDRVFFVGCPEAEPACSQNVYRGYVLRVAGDGLSVGFYPPVSLTGLHGGPLLNLQGEVVGLLSRTEYGYHRGGRGSIAKADDSLIRQVQACEAAAARSP